MLQAIEDVQEEDAEVSLLDLDNLAGVVMRQWVINQQHYDREHKQDLLDAHRMRAGKYSAQQEAEIRITGGSPVYAPLASMQSISAAASVAQVAVPPALDRKAWSVSPTSIPEMPEEDRRTIDSHLQAQRSLGKQGRQIEMDRIEAEKATMRNRTQDAKVASEKMEKLIHDQLSASGFYDTLMGVIEDFATYPFAVMKRITTLEKRLKFSGGKVAVEEIPVDRDVRVSPFDFYPSPGMVGVDDGPLIERMRLEPHELASYRARGFDSEKIDDVLDRATSGHGMNWLSTYSDSERNAVEENEGLNWQQTGLIDVLRYWGRLRGKELLEYDMRAAWARKIEPDKYYDTEIWIVGSDVIRVFPNTHPLERRPYYKVVWRSVPGQFAGSSPTLQVKHIEMICNASMRALVNNMSIASGPQIVVFIDQLPAGEATISAIHPLKVWQMQSKAGVSQPPVSFFQPTSNAKELIGVFQFFWELSGDVTGIYRWNHLADRGTQGAAQTTEGLSVMLENQNKVVRHALRNLERWVVSKRVYDQFLINMVNGDNRDVVGDIDVTVKGSSSLIEEASTRKRRNEMLGTLNGVPEMKQPILSEMFSKIRLGLIREMAMDMNLPENSLPSEGEMDAVFKQIMQAKKDGTKDPRVDAAKISAQARIEDQKLEIMDHREHREHQKEIKQMEMETARIQRMSDQQAAFERHKMNFAANVARLKQDERKTEKELELKRAGKTGI